MLIYTLSVLLVTVMLLPAQDFNDLIDGTTKNPKKEPSILDDLIEGKTKGYPVR